MARFFLLSLRRMKQIKLFLIFLMALAGSPSIAQSVNGYWYGTANVNLDGQYNNYLVELVLRQSQGGQVQGILSYFFTNRYRSTTIKGSYDKVTRELKLNEVPVAYFRSTLQHDVDCYMNFSGILRVAQAGSSIKGNFSSTADYRYTCPELSLDIKLNGTLQNEDSVLTAIKTFKEENQVWKPSEADTLVAARVQTNKVINYVIDRQYRERQAQVIQELETEGDSLKVDFYDNGEVDGDSIAIFMNGKLIAYHQRLSTKAVTFSMALDSLLAVNEISMFAENMGLIAPNTALMVISDGISRHEVRMSSSYDKNATIRIKRKRGGLKIKQ